jgi:hypothetical protein
MQTRRLLVWTTLFALSVTAVVAIAVLLTRSFGDTTWRILGTTTAIAVGALLAVPVGALLERSERRLLARTSGVLTGVTFVLTVVGIWHTSHDAAYAKTWAVIGTLALAAAQACAVESRRRDSDTRSTRLLVTGSSITGSALAGLGSLAIVDEIDSGGFYRVLGAVAILDLLLVVAVAVVRRGAGPIDQRHRLRLDGRLIESPGRDFAAAAANAIREAERAGQTVRRVERA